MSTRRPLESGLRRDLRGDLTYSDYLRFALLLSAQQPLSERHDELLFIIQHQTSELWMRLLIHELESACRNLAADRMNGALKDLARVKHIQRQLFEQWAVLETLTPSEYADFRDLLSRASGFQSLQYRIIEFRLGNKSPEMLEVFDHDAEGQERRWEEYELCEELVDIEESFQLWRFRHLKTVERIIGGKEGTGGSSGTAFLRAALDLRFFPELWDVRTEIGR